jgi:hypothetical protein
LEWFDGTWAAPNNWVHEIEIPAGVDVAIDCNITPQFYQGMMTITALELRYGIESSPFTSASQPTIAIISYPAPGAPAGSSVSAAGGILTVTPSPLLLAQSNLGDLATENIALGTPIVLNFSGQKRITLEQQFVASAQTRIQFGGLTVHYQ